MCCARRTSVAIHENNALFRSKNYFTAGILKDKLEASQAKFEKIIKKFPLSLSGYVFYRIFVALVEVIRYGGIQ